MTAKSFRLLLVFLSATSVMAAPEADWWNPAANVHEIRLEMGPGAVDQLRREPRGYVRASAQVDGSSRAEIGVHLKGATGSFRPLDDKPSLTLDLDRFVPGQQFGGTSKLHLNNSVEDPSLLCEVIGSELFRRVGIPTPRVTHARVSLNGRRLGLYVLKEGFTPKFIRREFGSDAGTLFEPEPTADISGTLRTDAQADSKNGPTNLRALADAASEPDLSKRWERLSAVLDREQFLTFAVTEVILGHRDGYSLARNNYRVHLASTGKAAFLPHGMDQLFATPQAPWEPQMAGLAARAVLATPEGRQRYRERFGELLPRLLDLPSLTNRVNELAGKLRPFASVTEAGTMADETRELCGRIALRAAELQRQLAEAAAAEVKFTNGVASLDNWLPVDSPAGGNLAEVAGPDTVPSLHIAAGPVTAASWQTQIILPPGRYRFEGRVTTKAVQPLPFGQNQGAALRVSGNRSRSAGQTGDTPWQPLAVEFEVTDEKETIRLMAELRGSSGEAWFDRASLRLVRR